MRTLNNISAELDHALREAVRERVGPFGGAVASIRRDLDHDGDECIYVEVEYTAPETPFDPLNIVGLDGALRDVAYGLGEHDILYVHNHFRPDQKIDQATLDRMLSKPPRHVRG